MDRDVEITFKKDYRLDRLYARVSDGQYNVLTNRDAYSDVIMPVRAQKTPTGDIGAYAIVVGEVKLVDLWEAPPNSEIVRTWGV